MKTFITDMGTEYNNSFKHIISTAHHHQTVGTVEQSHITFNEFIGTYISTDKTDWVVWLKYFVYCLQ